MKRLPLVISLGCVTAIFPACKKDMPAIVAPRWASIEALAKDAGPVCDRVLALPACPIEADGLPHPEAGPEVRLPGTPLVDQAEVREIEVYCEAKQRSRDDFSHSCYLQGYFDPKGPQRGASLSCGRNKPYPGWESAKDGLAFAYEDGCKENLYHAWMRRPTPAGNTIQTAVYFYVDGRATTLAPAPLPK